MKVMEVQKNDKNLVAMAKVLKAVANYYQFQETN
jgi:hypothetical protein